MQQDEETGLPVRAGLDPTGLYLALRQIGRDQLQDAFMQETIARVPAPDRIVHVARDDARPDRERAPVGIVFHVARCGSTLVSPSLKRLNEILAERLSWPRADMVAALRALGAAFARHAQGRYVLKLSSWNTLYCDIVTAAFPDTPWVLSFRDPVEVGVSLLASPPGWFQGTTEAARGLAACVDPERAGKSPEEFVARVYGAFCAAAAELDASRGRLVPYESLPAAVWDIVAPHFSLSVDDSQRQQIADGARRHAKAAIGASVEFKSDVASKQDAASAQLRRAIDSLARPQLERLLRLHAATMRQ